MCCLVCRKLPQRLQSGPAAGKGKQPGPVLLPVRPLQPHQAGGQEGGVWLQLPPQQHLGGAREEGAAHPPGVPGRALPAGGGGQCPEQ